jgi:hypothetical protein
MDTEFDKLAEVLEIKKKLGQEEYHFRPVKVDNVYCYIILYFKHSILTVECVNIKCKYVYEGTTYNQPYVIYHRKYTSFKNALKFIPKLTTKYKILNGDLESPENYEELKLEECILPYSDNEVCSVCFDHTTDTTICDHYICLKCRDQCILKKHLDCPICRNANVLPLYNNSMQLFNNRDNKDLSNIFLYNSYKDDIEHAYSDSDTDEDESDDESETDDDSEVHLDDPPTQEEADVIYDFVIDRSGNEINIDLSNL